MNRLPRPVCSCALGILLSVTSLSSAATTIFHYRVNDTDAAGLPTVPSVEGPAGIADGEVFLSDNIPTIGVPAGAGNRSLGAGGIGGIVSADLVELSNDLIADEGGFTYETWFFWDGAGDINSIIDYSGTEKLVIDVNQGSSTELRMRVNSNGALDSYIADVEPETWYYAAVVFDTEGNEMAEDFSITGVFNLYLDGELMDTTDEVTITEFGDSLGRSIGILQHPLAFSRDFFDGLVYEPRVSLGALTESELLWSGGMIRGDFNGNQVIDLEDVNLLTMASAAGTNDPMFDLNGDDLVNAADVTVWAKDVEIGNTWLGDSNFDGEFNSSDFVQVFTFGKFELAVDAKWSEGDWNGDGRFDSSDFVAAFTDGGFELGPRAAVPIPEPTTLVLLAIGGAFMTARRRRS